MKDETKEKMKDVEYRHDFALEGVKRLSRLAIALNPLSYLTYTPGEAGETPFGETPKSKKDNLMAQLVSTEDTQKRMKEWVTHTGEMFEKAWDLGDMTLEDLINIYQEAKKDAESETTHKTE